MKDPPPAADPAAASSAPAADGAELPPLTASPPPPDPDASQINASEYSDMSELDVTVTAISLEAFRDDGFVQDHIMPLRRLPLLSPRSQEALRRQGLVVEEIMPQFGPAYSIDASKLGSDPFEEQMIPTDIINKRIGRQEQKRRELIEMLVWEREKIISEGPRRDLSDLNLGGDDSSSALQAERNKVKAMQNRQKAKMEQALLHELRTQQAEATHLANLAESNRRADREKGARERRKREIENEKREKEMGKKEQEELEGKINRKKALEQYDREQEMVRMRLPDSPPTVVCHCAVISLSVLSDSLEDCRLV